MSERLQRPERRRAGDVPGSQQGPALYRQDRARQQQRSVLRGLVWLLAAVLLFSMLRAGWSGVFPPHWWLP